VPFHIIILKTEAVVGGFCCWLMAAASTFDDNCGFAVGEKLLSRAAAAAASFVHFLSNFSLISS